MADVYRAGELPLTALSDIQAAGFAGYATPIHSDPVALADRVRSENIDLWASFGIREGDATAVQVFVARRGERARVASMGVPPQFRRRGWGRRALQIAIDEARERGDSLQLEVLTNNDGAVALYEDMGFVSRRTLVGFDGPLDGLRGSSTSGRAAREARNVGVAEVAAQVAAHGRDLTWQLDAPSLYGLGSGWRGWTNGAAYALTKRRDDVLAIVSLLTLPDARRRGHARDLLTAIARAEPEARTARVISIVPQGVADGFFAALGFREAELRQFEMHLER